MRAKDCREFQMYLAACTDRQVVGVYEKELAARRYDYARMAKAEMRLRNVEQ